VVVLKSLMLGIANMLGSTDPEVAALLAAVEAARIEFENAAPAEWEGARQRFWQALRDFARFTNRPRSTFTARHDLRA
jgi:hypothetical protein